ncbi:iron complex outermembrane receptor protein [Novosphingobium sp. 1529]|uniref:TonB-dependent receptor n=1 Tax=Novosphingobium sp. 1529 TaxID=3156424 RepID=UPI0033954A4A
MGNHNAIGALLASVAFGYAGPALAQAAPASAQPGTAPEPAAAKSDSPATQEIIVTALKRSENLHEVPATVQVVDTAQLRQANITSLVNISQLVPSMQMYISPLGNPALFLYGMGTPASGTTFEQSVMPIVDGVADGHSRSLLMGLYDVSGIEVVKGTQSILGKNASLGAISVTTQKPTDKFELKLGGGYEFNLKSYKFDGAINVPISETLKVRVAGLYDVQKGWVRNDYLNKDWPRTRTFSGRASVAWDPAANFNYVVSVQVDNRHTDGTAAEMLPLSPAGGAAAGLCALTATTCDFTGNYHNQEGLTPWGAPNTQHDLVRASGTGTLTLQGATLTAITGYVHYRSTSVVDVDQVPTDAFSARVRERDTLFSQELRLANADKRRLEWTVGLVYAHDHFSLPIDQRGVAAPIANPAVPGTNLFAVTGEVDFGYQQYTGTMSAYGQAFYHLTDALQFGGGLRYTSESRKADISNTTVTPGLYSSIVQPPFPSTRVVRSDENLDYSVLAKYAPTTRFNLYASYGQGTKSGGFNNQPKPAATYAQFAANASYAQEVAHTLEAGAKWSLGRYGYINLSGFSVKVDNFQNATTVGPSIFYLSRNQRSRGFTLDATLRPVSDIALRAQVTYADTLDETINAPLVQAPAWSGIVGADFNHQLGIYRFGAGADLSFRSSFWTRQPSNPLTATDPLYHLSSVQRINAHISLASDAGHWTVSLIGRNLANTYILESAYSATGYTGAAIIPEKPRTVALQFNYAM